MNRTENPGGAPSRTTARAAEYDGLSMQPQVMLDLARKAAEFVVERIENLPKGDAWEGDFREALESKLMQDPPEEGRPGTVGSLPITFTGQRRGTCSSASWACMAQPNPYS